MKVALVGLSESSRHLAPWTDPSWELWGLAWDVERFKFHRAFEMHDRKDLEAFYKDGLAEYLDKIGCCSKLVTFDTYPAEAVEKVGGYFCSSMAYMLGLAIHEQAKEIALYGIDMTDDYGYQKPNMEYLIGFARGRGIKVHIPYTSPLCRHLNPPDRDYDGRYGRTKWQ